MFILYVAFVAFVVVLVVLVVFVVLVVLVVCGKYKNRNEKTFLFVEKPKIAK